MEFVRSEELFIESEKYIPGGVNSPVRAFKAVREHLSLFTGQRVQGYLMRTEMNILIMYVPGDHVSLVMQIKGL